MFKPDTRYEEGKKITRVPLEDFKTFYGRAKHLYYIRTKDNRLVTYVPNQGQKTIGDIVDQATEQSVRLRGYGNVWLIILKPRQIGATTDTALRIIDKMLTLNMCQALVTTHIGEDTEIIFDKYKICHENLPDYVELVDSEGNVIIDPKTGSSLIPFKPEERSDSAKQLRFGNQTKAWVNVRTAGSGDNLGKGGSLNCIHYTECMHPDSGIILANGEAIKAGDIKVGDKVFTSSGAIAPVKTIFQNGVKDTFLIKTWLTNEGVILSEDHKVLTDTGYKKVKDLTKNDWIRQPRRKLTNTIKNYKYKLEPYSDRDWYTGNGVTEHEFELNYDFGYFLGYYLAEGHVKKMYNRPGRFCSIQFAYHNDEKYIKQASIIPNSLGIKGTTKKRPDTKTTHTTFHNTFLAHVVNDICGRVESKHIPEWFFETNEEFVKGVVSGYLHGDGSKNSITVNKKYTQNNIVSVSIHEKITRQLKRLLYSLNIPGASIKKESNVYRYDTKGKDTWRCFLFGESAKLLGELLNNKNQNQKTNPRSNKWKIIDGEFYVKFKSKDYYETTNVIDIEVDHEDHNFETPIGVISNCANYDHFGKVIASSSQQLPEKGEVYVVLESTANGTTGSGEGFYKTWVLAEAGYEKFKRGENQSYEGYIPVFVPWYIIDEYQLPLQNGQFVDLDGIDFGGPEGKERFLEKEILLMSQYDVSPERINWYRYIIKQKCNYSIQDANRYYPTFAEDAFLSTDKCFFDSNKLFSIQKSFDDGSLKIATTQGYLDEDLQFVKSMGGELVVIQEPDPDSVNRYICSLDTSKGVEDGDYTTMKVLDRLTEKWVAHWTGKMAEDLVAKEYVKLCIYYNYALMMPEVNRATVIDMVKPGGVYEYEGPIYFSDFTNDGDYKWGFNTLSNTRKILLDKYKAWLRDNYNKLNVVEDVEEHLSFVRTISSRGMVKYQADSGKKDDRVIASALAIYAHHWWDEEIGFLNKEKTDFTNIVKIEVNNKKKIWGSRQSELGKNNTRVHVVNNNSNK